MNLRIQYLVWAVLVAQWHASHLLVADGPRVAAMHPTIAVKHPHFSHRDRVPTDTPKTLMPLP